MEETKYIPISSEIYDELNITEDSVFQSYIDNKGELVIRVLNEESDLDNFVCNGECEGCPFEDMDLNCDFDCESCPCGGICLDDVFEEDDDCKCPYCGNPV